MGESECLWFYKDAQFFVMRERQDSNQDGEFNLDMPVWTAMSALGETYDT